MIDQFITLNVDGSCLHNPGGKGGWAAVFEGFGSKKVLYGSVKSCTNNQMELLAAIRGLTHIKVPSSVLLFTDSQYVYKGYTQYLANWKRNGWKARKGPVKNKDYWVQLEEAVERHQKVAFNWTPGHGDSVDNNLADMYARTAAYDQLDDTVKDLMK